MYIEQQNDKILTGTLRDDILISLDTVGVISAGIDWAVTVSSHHDIGYNNSYGFQAIT